MSIKSELERAEKFTSDAFNVIDAKGGTITTRSLSGLASAINSIKTSKIDAPSYNTAIGVNDKTYDTYKILYGRGQDTAPQELYLFDRSMTEIYFLDPASGSEMLHVNDPCDLESFAYPMFKVSATEIDEDYTTSKVTEGWFCIWFEGSSQYGAVLTQWGDMSEMSDVPLWHLDEEKLYMLARGPSLMIANYMFVSDFIYTSLEAFGLSINEIKLETSGVLSTADTLSAQAGKALPLTKEKIEYYKSINCTYMYYSNGIWRNIYDTENIEVPLGHDSALFNIESILDYRKRLIFDC